tara:strand:+ start:769 stop:2037 length:1269 start_codon:yes stop_codon:yes gene_type:complete
LNKYFTNFSDDILKAILYLRKHGIWMLSGKIFLMGSGLIISIILTRLLSLSEYGEYRYLFSLLLIFAFFSLPASTNAIIRFVPQGKDWSFISLSKLRMKASVLGSIAFLCLALNAHFSKSETSPFIYVLLSLFFPIYHSFDLFEYFLQAKEKFKKLTILQVLRAFIRLTATVLICWITKSAVYTLITFLCITSVFNIISYILIKRDYHIIKDSRIFSKSDIHKMAVRLSIVGLLPMVSNHLDKILIGNYINTESLAIYTIGMLIGETINGLFKGILSVLNPKLVYYQIKSWQYLFVLIFGTIMGVLILYFLPLFLEFFYSNEYSESILYAKIVLLSLGIHLSVTLYHKQLLFHIKKSLNIIYLGQSIISVTKIVLVFLFVVLPSSNSTKLFLLAMMYPIKHVVTASLFFMSEKLFFGYKELN